jgi:drug/metabolite transporter (DMT)-like permease
MSGDLAPAAARRFSDAALAWYFVTVWGSGFVATKIGLQYSAPFTFLSLRFVLGIVLLAPLVWWMKAPWPQGAQEWLHVLVAGILMHAVHLSGSHYSQYLGLPAGVTAIILALQPLLTTLIAMRYLGERPAASRIAGIALGFLGVALVVWHKVGLDAVSAGALFAVGIALLALTAATLYQRRFCPAVDLRSGALIQFAASLAVTAPLAVAVEGFAIRWSAALVASIAFLVVFASIFAVNALHTLMRHNEASRVSGMLYLPPAFAVLAEWLFFGAWPAPLSLLGMVITCIGVALAMRGNKAP